MNKQDKQLLLEEFFLDYDHQKLFHLPEIDMRLHGC